MSSKMLSDFYNSKQWHKTIVEHYGKDPKFHSAKVLDAPVTTLTQSVELAIAGYSDFPKDINNLLKQTIDPLFDSGEYEKKVYTLLKRAAEEDKEPKYAAMADALMQIRQMFLQDKVVLPKLFQKEIDLVKEETPALKLLRFSEAIKTITKVHIEQITQMIDAGKY